jgi:TonB family protein
MPRRTDHPSHFRTAAILAAVGLVLGGCAAQPSYDELVRKATAIQEANEKRKCRVAIWVNHATGKVTRIEVVESSGDAAFDQLVSAQVLQMKVEPPPPAETPMPIYINVEPRPPNAAAS